MANGVTRFFILVTERHRRQLVTALDAPLYISRPLLRMLITLRRCLVRIRTSDGRGIRPSVRIYVRTYTYVHMSALVFQLLKVKISSSDRKVFQSPTHQPTPRLHVHSQITIATHRFLVCSSSRAMMLSGERGTRFSVQHEATPTLLVIEIRDTLKRAGSQTTTSAEGDARLLLVHWQQQTGDGAMCG